MWVVYDCMTHCVYTLVILTLRAFLIQHSLQLLVVGLYYCQSCMAVRFDLCYIHILLKLCGIYPACLMVMMMFVIRIMMEHCCTE